ncbi:DUF418 domain-containing protein [Lysinibacillus sp. FSL K6-0232]|uniref:DUF418 domain-containing protein n=1 Tax=unclassified Lysinibacillus TaxID=2636778 RepID=UPI0030F62EE4
MNSSIPQQERIVSLDIIRGLALLGILFINVGAYQVMIEGGPMPDYSGINGVIDALINIFIEKKFFSIFSFLFGVGFYIFASRAEARGDQPKRCFARRLIALFIIGIVHIVIFWGSILAMYAVIGFLLLPFYRAQMTTIRRWLFAIMTLHLLAIVGQLFIAHNSVVNFLGNDAMTIFIMFLSGFYVAKAGWIQQCSDNIKWILYITCPFFIGFSIWIWFASQADYAHIQAIISLGTIPTAYFYLACLFILLDNKQLAKLLQPIGRVGQMALTNYLCQSLIGTAIISLMGLEVVSPSNIAVIALLIFAIQIIFSVIWFKFFTMGPFEKLWRYMTYGKKVNG